MKPTPTTDITEKDLDKNLKKSGKRRVQPLLLNDMSPFLIREAYKAIRANINFALGAKKECKKFIITSSSSAEGKTTSCINLSIAFAQTKAKVLLIDADMRKPSIHKYIGIKNTSGLSNVLSGFTQLNEVIKKTQHGFDCLPAGPTPPNPAELLMAQPCADLLNTLSQYYDYIILDTPPVGIVSDSLGLVDKIDGSILIVRENFSTHENFQKAVAALQFADAKILGFVLNDSLGEGNSYKYRYRYRNNYKHYDYGEDYYNYYY